MQKLSLPEKLSLARQIADEILHASERKYRRLSDLLALTRDKKDVDVVLKAVDLLCQVFAEIIPSYRLREDVNTDEVETG